ncbi:MAG: hypothetical protein ACI9KE_001883 [Polyangiales bacterium]|jgi:hypothetical protein
MSVDHEQIKKESLRQVWLGVFVAICVSLAAGYVVMARGPDIIPPPVNNVQSVAFELEEGCELRVALPGAEANVLYRPQTNAMIVDSIPHNTVLRFDSVRTDWVEVTHPAEGWVSRRDVATVCPEPSSGQ